jgi:hypothetical protein
MQPACVLVDRRLLHIYHDGQKTGSEMQDILRRFENILTEQDMLTVRIGVEELLRMYVPRSASPELRKAICELLNRAAAEASNRVLTNYLRTVSHTIEQFTGPSNSAEIKPAPEDKTPAPDRGPRGLNSLGQYLSSKRK